MSLARTRYADSLLRLLLIPAALLLLHTLLPGNAAAQMKNNHVSWKLLTPEIKGKPGDKVEVKVQANIVPKAHLYTTKKYPDSAAGPEATEITVGDKKLITRAGGVKGSKAPKKVQDKNFEDLTTEFWEGSVTLTIPVKIAKNAKPGERKGWTQIYFMTCNDQICRPPTDERFEFTVVVEEDSTALDSLNALAETDSLDNPLDTAADGGKDSIPQVTATVTPGNTPPNEPTITNEFEKAQKEGLWSVIITAFLAGFVALSTPCVFPMIPITVSFFTKREHQNRLHAVRDAGVYAIGIIATFSVIGVGVAALFQASDVNDIATNPWINIVISTIFIAFALSLFGLFEIQVPSSLLNKINRKADQSRGATGILLMSLVFTLTSFTCSLPMAAPILLAAQKGHIWTAAVGMTAFAVAFATPFVLLAIFPSLLKAMPKSGGWLNAVKVTMGFVEIAAAMKFLSNIDLVWNLGILTREIVLALWIAIAILASLYLLGRFRLPHDTPLEKIGVVRMLFSMGFLTLGFWFLTGLFGGRLGEVDAFLPPQEYPGRGNTSILASLSESGAMSQPVAAASTPADTAAEGTGSVKRVRADGLEWIQDDYQAALAESKRTGKPLFVDFTGYTCTNCRWMERNVFTRDDVRELMNRYVLARLYTDRREESNKRNRQIQVDRFQSIDLPLYALVSPEDKVLAHAMYTRDIEEFKGFLKRGLGETQVAMQRAEADKANEEMAIR